MGDIRNVQGWGDMAGWQWEMGLPRLGTWEWG